MLFAHLKRILHLPRLRLRSLSGAHDENLKRNRQADRYEDKKTIDSRSTVPDAPRASVRPQIWRINGVFQRNRPLRSQSCPLLGSPVIPHARTRLPVPGLQPMVRSTILPP
jgi:hypothetical protein